MIIFLIYLLGVICFSLAAYDDLISLNKPTFLDYAEYVATIIFWFIVVPIIAGIDAIKSLNRNSKL